MEPSLTWHQLQDFLFICLTSILKDLVNKSLILFFFFFFVFFFVGFSFVFFISH